MTLAMQAAEPAPGGGSPGVLEPPFASLARLHVALAEPMRGGYASACARATRLVSRMRAVPEYLRTLLLDRSRGPEGRWSSLEAGLDETEAMLELCRRAPITAFDDCREGTVQADLAEADSQAVRALEDFRDELRDRLRTRADGAFGGNSTWIAGERELVSGFRDARDADANTRAPAPSAVLARVRSELDALGAPEPSAPPDTTHRRLTASDAAAVLDAVRATIAHDRLATLRDRDRLVVSGLPPLPGAIPPEPMWAPGPWEEKRTPSRLDLGGWPSESSGALARDPHRSTAALELCVVREGVPGRALWAFTEARLTSRLRQAFAIAAVRDGWARYVETMWVEHSTGARRAALEREHRALERERLARAAVELMLRVERAAPDSAAEWLAASAGLAPEDASRAVRRAIAAPSFAASTVAMWEMIALRADLERELGPRFRLGAFHDAVLRAGAVPMDALRDEVRAALLAPAKGKR